MSVQGGNDTLIVDLGRGFLFYLHWGRFFFLFSPSFFEPQVIVPVFVPGKAVG